MRFEDRSGRKKFQKGCGVDNSGIGIHDANEVAEAEGLQAQGLIVC